MDQPWMAQAAKTSAYETKVEGAWRPQDLRMGP